MTPLAPDASRLQVRRVLVITLLVNVVVAVSKIAVGAGTGAVSITADGFHSLMDGSANVIGLAANRVATRPPDAAHPYGHRRFETAAALGIGVLLLITAWEIIGSALERLQTGDAATVTPLSFIVLITTLIANVFVSRYQRREGARLRSELLIADSANTGVDVYVTLSVLVSMGLVALGARWADPVAALLIVVLIGRAAWQIIRQTGNVLLDRAPFTPDEIAAVAEAVPAVERVLRARSRGPADAAFIDVDVEVPPATTADQTAAIAEAIRARLAEQFGAVQEVEVHFEPASRTPTDDDIARIVSAQAAALGMAAHAVHVSGGDGEKVLEVHLEVPSGQTLAEAHAQAEALERGVLMALPQIGDVVTHIEPANRAVEPEAVPSVDEEERLAERAGALLSSYYPDVGWHNIRALPVDGGYALVLHAAMPADLSVETAHLAAEAAELALRGELPEVQRVTIHTEPGE